MPDLFAYGTLADPALLNQLIGRAPAHVDATLPDHAAWWVTGCEYPGLVAAPGAATRGRLLLDLNAAELARIDRYEGEEYHRVVVVVVDIAGGRRPALTYLFRDRFRDRLSDRRWKFA